MLPQLANYRCEICARPRGRPDLRQMAHPASVDSTPTSANQKDHDSMLVMSTWHYHEDLFTIFGIEALVAAQSIEFWALRTQQGSAERN